MDIELIIRTWFYGLLYQKGHIRCLPSNIVEPLGYYRWCAVIVLWEDGDDFDLFISGPFKIKPMINNIDII